VGGAGANGSFSAPAAGGYNGGGNAGFYIGAGGGGASDIRTGGTALSNRVIVAGGGGGGGSAPVAVSGHERGGNGGGTTGQNGYYGNINTGTEGGRGGTPTAGGAGGTGSGPGVAGSLGTGGAGSSASYAGGGGGGYYGGGGGSFAGGGGGSSYAGSGTGSVAHTSGHTTGNGLVIISAGTSAGTISGTTTVAAGSTTTLTASVGGGTWSSASTGIATISSGGVVTGVSAGTAVISYAVSGCSGMAYTTTTVTVTAADCITGDVIFSGTPYYHNVKVWLIKYNPSTLMLSACDSTIVATTGGTTASYSFCGMGTDSFRVKAACDTLMTTSGFLPTYHTASNFWHSATVIYHVSGTTDAGKNITMAHGTAPSGPGFIAGNVTTGANKGTSGIPAVGLLIYCIDNATGTILQQTLTDASGNYSFSSLPVGQTYKIYPELINYATTPYPPITLTSSTPSMNVADFVQRTISHLITPIITGVTTLPATGTAAYVFPNPATNLLTINADAAGYNTFRITNHIGQQLIEQPFTATKTDINIGLLPAGVYYVQLTGPAGSIVEKFVKQ
jgi:hypothetical protein